jgi:hypothetical protein
MIFFNPAVARMGYQRLILTDKKAAGRLTRFIGDSAGYLRN